MQGPGKPPKLKGEKKSAKPVKKIQTKIILPIVLIVILAVVAAFLLVNQKPDAMQDSGTVTSDTQNSGVSAGVDTSNIVIPDTTSTGSDDDSMQPIETNSGADTSSSGSTQETALGSFEYYDLNGDFAQLTADEIPGKEVHFVVAGDGSSWDVSNHLPITITITHDGGVVWLGTITAEKGDYGWKGFVNCRGADGCSTDGPEIKEEWTGDLIIEARDAEGILLAEQVFENKVAVLPGSGEEGGNFA